MATTDLTSRVTWAGACTVAVMSGVRGGSGALPWRPESRGGAIALVNFRWLARDVGRAVSLVIEGRGGLARFGRIGLRQFVTFGGLGLLIANGWVHPGGGGGGTRLAAARSLRTRAVARPQGLSHGAHRASADLPPARHPGSGPLHVDRHGHPARGGRGGHAPAPARAARLAELHGSCPRAVRERARTRRSDTAAAATCPSWPPWACSSSPPTSWASCPA